MSEKALGFLFRSQEVRVFLIDDAPWFVVKDVCDVLGLTNTTEAVRGIDKEDKCTLRISEGGPEANMVNESGLYSLIMRSNKPDAKAFKRWVTSEILPSIRKHGAYMTPATLESMIASPEFGIKLLTALKEEQEKNAVLLPKAKAWEDFSEDEGNLLSARQIPKRYAFAGFNETAVKECAIELGIRCKSINEPTAEALRSGLARMMTEEITINGRVKNVAVMKYRMKAVEMIVNHWKVRHGRLW